MKLNGFALLKNVAILPRQDAEQTGQVPQRVNLALVREADARPAHKRDFRQELRIKPQLRREARILLQSLDLGAGRRRLSCGGMQVTGNPFETALNSVLPDERLDLLNGRPTRVPG